MRIELYLVAAMLGLSLLLTTRSYFRKVRSRKTTQRAKRVASHVDFYPVFVMALLLASPSFAEGFEPYPRLTVNLVTVPLRGAPNYREAKAIFRVAHRKYAEIGVNLSLVKVRERFKSYDRGFLPKDDKDWGDRFYSIRSGWRKYFRTRAVKRAVNVALIPRMEWSDGPKMGGMASGICELKTAVAWAAVSVADERLRRAAPIILAHEIGHLAGASHGEDWDISIMSPSPTFWLDLVDDLDFSSESRVSIQSCLRNRGAQ